MDPSGGKRFGPYTIEGVIARGGQGAISRAVGPDGRPCAIKMLTNRSPQALARFAQEAKVLAALSHPNLLRVTDLGQHNQIPFMAMELVDGEDLAQRCTRGAPPFDWTARVLGTVAHALHTCHQAGLVHRDLKPANVMIEAGTERPVLVDFGMVKRDPEQMKLDSLQDPLSLTGEIRGTPKYMAPEQAAPQTFGAVSPRSDVYALGATLYTLLTRSPPFEGDSLALVLSKVIGETPRDPRELNPEVPPALAAFCLRCLAKAPQARPESVEAFATELARLTGQLAWLPRFPAAAFESPPVGTPLTAKDPTALGPYRLLSLLGRGGMGSVYLGQHRVLGILRAVKVLDGMALETRRQRFGRELRHLARVRHPNVVSIHDSGLDGKWAWYAMDLIHGEDLSQRLETSDAIPWEEACRIGLGVARGLGALHAAGVVHRDLKPANVVLRADGRPVVLDLGLAIAPELDERLTKTGAILGTPFYMSPEQVHGKPADPRSDVYALGLVLYELLTGDRAVNADSVQLVLAAVLHQTPPPPSSTVPDVPRAVDAVCRRALDKAAENRPADGNAFAHELREALEGGGDASRSLRGVWLMVAVVLLALGAAAFAFSARTEAEAQPVATNEAPPAPEQPTEAPAPRPLTAEELEEGVRARRRLDRLETKPKDQAAGARAWLQTFTDAHPAADEVKTILHAAELRYPHAILDAARARFLDDQRFVTWRRAGPEALTLRGLDRPQTALAEWLSSTAVVATTLSPDRTQLFVIGWTKGRLRRIDLAKSKELRRFDLDPTLQFCDVAHHPEQPLLAVAAAEFDGLINSRVLLVDAATGETLHTIPTSFRQRDSLQLVAFSPDGRYLIAGGGGTKGSGAPNAVAVWTLEDRKALRPKTYIHRVNAVASCGDLLAVGTNGGQVLLHASHEASGADRQLTASGAGLAGAAGIVSVAMEGCIRALTFSPDGATLYTGCGDHQGAVGALAAWDVVTGKRTRFVDGLLAVTTISVSTDGKWLAVGSHRKARDDDPGTRRVEIWRAR